MSEMIDPQLFSDYGRLATHEWRHRLNIRQFFKDGPTAESMDALLRHTVNEIERVKTDESRRVDSDESSYFIEQLGSLKSDFDVLIASSDMEVDDLVQEFDYHLAELYDLGDRRIQLRDGKLQKFMWVG